VAPPLTPDQIAHELGGLQVELPPPALVKLSTYLELLLQWNRRVNLTGLKEPRLIIRCLFGESLFLARFIKPAGRLLDVGSGAGFPGLALKLAAPELQVTLLEARRKKCAFLREVARKCNFYGVEVINERLEAWASVSKEVGKFHFITTRAVKMDKSVLSVLGELLDERGSLVITSGKEVAAAIRSSARFLLWRDTVSIPTTLDSVVLIGSSAGNCRP